MAKPSSGQIEILTSLKEYVLTEMQAMPFWRQETLLPLQSIPLAVLRKNATQRHGVTRFLRGARATALKTEDVETIDLHPNCLRTDGSITLVLFCIMNTFMLWGTDSMMHTFAILSCNGHILEQIVDVNLPSIFASELQHGYGFVLHVKRNTLDERKRMVVSDVAPARQFLPTWRTCRKQTKQVMISRRVEVPSCTGDCDAPPSLSCCACFPLQSVLR